MIRTCLTGLAPALLLATTALAHAPGVEITAPSAAAVVYVDSFPADVPITFTVEHDALSNVTPLRGEVDDEEFFNVGNPFQGNICNTTQMTEANGILACFLNSAIKATVAAAWQVPAPGTYAIVISARHASATGSDDEEVEVLLVDVEWPAPTAVANAHINTTYARPWPGRVRGCVISRIANNHAMHNAYGPKGGPYDHLMIYDHLAAYYTECS